MNGIASQVAQHGLGLVFTNVLLQQVGVPIPAEPTLVVAGSLAAKRLMSGSQLVAVTIAAATLADLCWFLLGRRWGARVLRFVAKVSGSARRRLPDERADRTNGTFARWGPRALVLAKFLPGVSQLIVPMSGATGVPFRSFLFYDLVGTLVWAAVPIGSGMIFHEQVDGVLAAMSRVGLWFLLALAVGVAGALAWRYASRAATH